MNLNFIYENCTLVILVTLIILVLLFWPKKKEKFHYIGMHNYHKDSYKLGLHGRKRIPYHNFMQLINFLLL